MRVLLRGARQLLTLRGSAQARRGAALDDVGMVPDGALLIDQGRIVEAGPARRIENLAIARKAREIDVAGRVVLPGFVDCHTHLVCGLPRLDDFERRISGQSYTQIAAAGGGITQSMRSVRSLTQPRLLVMAREAVGRFARHGTTTLEGKSGYGLNETSELKQLRVMQHLDGEPLDIVPTLLGAHAVPPEFEDRADEYVEWLCDVLLPMVARRSLARFADIYVERHAFRALQAERYLAAARACGLRGKVHAEQFSVSGGTRVAVASGAVSADHLEHAGTAEIDLLARSETMAVLLPGSVFHLGLDRYAPARQLIAAGAAIAIATDFNPGTSPSCSMPMVLALACSQLRMTPAEAISAATINGAFALRCADRVGSLEPGKLADFCVFDVHDYREIPYAFGENRVWMAAKRGQVIYSSSEVQWQPRL